MTLRSSKLPLSFLNRLLTAMVSAFSYSFFLECSRESFMI